jgi:hypothetical protein|tara:strand:- start:545 stop:787 length:243 start_codon:yes stop_codon:yes gene_type:complete
MCSILFSLLLLLYGNILREEVTINDDVFERLFPPCFTSLFFFVLSKNRAKGQISPQKKNLASAELYYYYEYNNKLLRRIF